MHASSFVSNNSSALKVVQGVTAALTKVISSTAIIGSTDAALALNAATEVVLVQVKDAAVWLNLHTQTPDADNALELAAGTILELSASEWGFREMEEKY
jgi:hypothetical protein